MIWDISVDGAHARDSRVRRGGFRLHETIDVNSGEHMHLQEHTTGEFAQFGVLVWIKRNDNFEQIKCFLLFSSGQAPSGDKPNQKFNFHRIGITGENVGKKR